MKYGLYSFFRFLFGVYLIWLGIYNLGKLEANSSLVKTSIEGYTVYFSHFKQILSVKSGDLFNYQLPNYSFNIQDFLNSSDELVYLMNFALIIGGILCAFGYRVSYGFIMIGLLMNIILVHNYFYFLNEKMKVNVLKMLALLGGALHVI